MRAPPPLAASSASRWLQSPWLRPFNDRGALEELTQRLLPRAAIAQIRARVEFVIDESADTRSFVLLANRHWPGFRAGQHVLVTMEVDGRRLQRCFSISSAPTRAQRLTITVKRQSESGVTAWMHQYLDVGAIVTLSPPFGDFGLPAKLPQSILMLSAGSGITPMMSMLRHLQAQRYAGDIVLLHSCRTPADAIFAAELQSIASDLPALRIIWHFSNSQGRLDAQQLAHYVPDFAQRFGLLCGPPPFADWVHALYHRQPTPNLLRSESFGPPRPSIQTTAITSIVRCDKSEQSFTAKSGQSLLLAAESAGLKPRHGCRIGICRTCQCRKRSGIVENLLTGEICAEPEQLIQLCISAARSPLALEL